MMQKKILSIGLVSCVIILHTQDAEVWVGVCCCEKQVGIWLSKACLTEQWSCHWRVTSQTVYIAKLSIPEMVQTSADLHSRTFFSCMPQTSLQFRDSLLLLPANPALPAQETNNLTFCVTLEIPSSTGRFTRSSPGWCAGTCRRHVSIWSRSWEQGSVPEASQPLPGACVSEAQQDSPGLSYKTSSD